MLHRSRMDLRLLSSTWEVGLFTYGLKIALEKKWNTCKGVAKELPSIVIRLLQHYGAPTCVLRIIKELLRSKRLLL